MNRISPFPDPWGGVKWMLAPRPIIRPSSVLWSLFFVGLIALWWA